MFNKMKTKGLWTAKCYDKEGNLKWEDGWKNRVPNDALDYSLEASLTGGTQTTTWYVGLTGESPTTDASDTMGSHSGWSEITDYSETARPEWVPGSVSDQSVDNSASVASFTGSTNGTTVGGAFLVSDDEKGGTSGTLFSVGAFEAGDKTLDDGDTLEVTVEVSNSSA